MTRQSARSMTSHVISLHSKRFRGVGEQRKIKERNRNGILPARNRSQSQNKKEGVGEGKEGNACGQTPGFWKPPFASERSSWVAGPVERYWHVSIKKGKLVYKNFSPNEALVVSFDSTVEIL